MEGDGECYVQYPTQKQPKQQQYPPQPCKQQPAPINQQHQPVNQSYNPPPQPQPVNQSYYPPPQPQPVNQPPPQPVNQSYNPPAGQVVTWSTDLFSCLDDINLCLLTNFLPCIPFGWIAEIVDKGTTPYATSARRYALAMVLPGTQFIYSGQYRIRMRQQYGIPGDSLEDVCVHIWCEGCALYQEYKELSARGYDVPIGWHGNMATRRQAQGVQMAPPEAPNGMTR